MITEPFAIGNSWIHKTNPGLKIIFATLYSFIIALSDKFPALVTGLLISIGLVAIAGLNIRQVSKRLTVVFGFLLLLWGLLPLTYEGPILYPARCYALGPDHPQIDFDSDGVYGTGGHHDVRHFRLRP